MSNEKADYEFKLLTPTDYELLITLKANGYLFNKIFVTARERIEAKTKIEIKGDINKVERFDIPKEYFNLIKTSIHKIINNVAKEVKQDNIIILNEVVKDCYFIKNGSFWDIKIKLGGGYADKR